MVVLLLRQSNTVSCKVHKAFAAKDHHISL